MFGLEVGRAVLERWGVCGPAQVVGQADILPVVVAKVVWRDRLAGRPVIVFVDNDAARHGLVAGYSPVMASARMLCASARLDARGAVFQWVARVPSPSNIADGPSRLNFEEARAEFGAELIDPIPALGGSWERAVSALGL